MHARFVVIAALAAMSGPAFAAEPAKPAPQPVEQAQQAPAEVVLASAEQAQAGAPAAQQPAVASKPHRVARVTTCRCGDQQAQPDDDQQ